MLIFNVFNVLFIFVNQTINFYFFNLLYKIFNKNCIKDRIILIKNITKKLETINIVYVKVFQSLFLEKNLFSDKEKDFLIKYTDNVPYNISDIDFIALNKLEEDFNIVIEDKQPINSGIVGLVFNAINKNDNQNVIVKVLRNNIIYNYNKAFLEIELLSKILNFIPYFNNFNLHKLLYDCKDNILNQVDFLKEVENIELFYKKFKHNTDYIIPYVYSDITKSLNNIIVMENIKGLNFSDIMLMDENIKYRFSKLLVKFGLLSILNYSCMQGDLHAGNIFFYIHEDKEPKYQLGIIDFGLCYFPSSENQNIYYKFFYNIQVKKDFTYLQEIVYGLISNKDYYNTFSDDEKLQFLELVKNCIIKYTYNKLDMYFFIDLSRLFKIHGLEYTKEFNNICMSLQICGSLGEQLNKNQHQLQVEVINEMNNINKLIEIE